MAEPDYMVMALAEAAAGAAAGEVPIGAVLVAEGRVLAKAQNRVERDRDPTAHAEMLAIRAGAAALGLKRLTTAQLWVTLEPCPMCAQAIALARLARLTFAAYDPKAGGVEHGARIFEQPTCNHRPQVVGGVQELAAQRLLRDFFKKRR